MPNEKAVRAEIADFLSKKAGPDFGRIDKPNLTIVINSQKSSCDKLVYKVRLNPSILAMFRPTVKVPFHVLGLRLAPLPHNGTEADEPKYECLELPSTGGESEERTISFTPLPGKGEGARRFVVMVDPLHQVSEWNEKDNYKTFTGSCVK